jgi:hypothetical protein
MKRYNRDKDPSLPVILRTKAHPDYPGVSSRRLLDWDDIHAQGLYTRTQARKLRLTLCPKPSAQYFSTIGWVRLFKVLKVD